MTPMRVALWLALLAAQAPAERNGSVLIEAESFLRQEKTEFRRWHIRRDGPAAAAASGGAYVQLLPDTRRTHADPLIKGENFSDEPGQVAVVSYEVRFATPGRYFVWVSAYSTGSEDNGIHVGLNGAWPESGRRLQWCEGKNSWRWESKQRTAQNHCGEEGRIYLDIETPGLHTIQFSMREDGFAFDRFLLTQAAGRPAP